MALAEQILNALSAASSPAQDVRQQGEAQLAQLRADPDAFFSTCATILVSPNANMLGRQLVGYQLKNNLQHPACANNPTLQTAVCQHAVVDPQKSIRAVACSIISLAVRENLWPVEPVVLNLTQLLTQRGSDLSTVHGVIRALSQIVDDCIYLLDMRQLTLTIVQAIQPFLLATHLGEDAIALEIRVKGLDIVAVVLEQAGLDFKCFTYRSMQGVVLSLIDICFSILAAPPSSAVAAKSINCLVLSLAFHTQISDELFRRMLTVMYHAIISPAAGTDEQLHIEATLFWGALLHFPRFAELAEPVLKDIIPVLIKAMVYSDMEMSMLQASAEDWQVPDKVDDIRPRHYQARMQATNADDDDEDDEDDAEVEEWNLRRVSARTLDEISEFFGERILLPVLTVLDAMMQPTEHWKQLEAAVLALGAICDGCFDALAPYLPAISTRLLELLEDTGTHFLVVNITLWTCTQIGRYIVQEPDRLQRLLHAILQKMQSPSKLVQESAASALERIAVLCEEGQLNSAAPQIVACIAQCLNGYQLKNRVLLFEVLETICETLGDALASDAATVEMLLRPLAQIWNSTVNDSPLLFSFFKCMSGVCTVLGPAMQPMAKDIFDRAYGILQYHMQLRVAAAATATATATSSAAEAAEEAAEPEFLITSADLLSGLFDALGSSLEPLVAQYQPHFMQVVLMMLRDENAEIRQSGFSLTGDIAKSCPTYLQAVLAPFCDAALANAREVNETSYGVVSNVAWSVCNLLEYQMDINDLPTLQMTPALPQLFALFANNLGNAELSADMRNMADNIALCLGLMLLSDPDIEAKAGCSVQIFARRFCEYVRNIKELPQRASAVNGFLLAVQRVPRVAVEHLTVFFDLACSITAENPETVRAMRQLLQHVKSSEPQIWQQRLSVYSEQLRAKLYHIYGLN